MVSQATVRTCSNRLGFPRRVGGPGHSKERDYQSRLGVLGGGGGGSDTGAGMGMSHELCSVLPSSGGAVC